MSTNDYIMNEASKVLACLHEIIGEKYFILAGGAVRDVILDKPIGDIDIFFFSALEFQTAKRHFNGARGIVQTKVSNDESYGERDWESHKYSDVSTGVEYNIIYNPKVGNTAQLLDTFDVGLCKIYFDIDKGVYKHPHFIEDMVNKTLTFRPNTGAKATEAGISVVWHIPKLIKKFPDYEVKIKYE